MEQNPATTDLGRPEESLLCVTNATNTFTSLTYAPDLSLEFLMGRALDNAMLNVNMKDAARGQSVLN